MKTLILNGSPHKKGDTAALTGALQGLLPGEVREVFSYFAQAGPCVDCRRCWKTEGCALHDGMDEIYAFLRQADNVVIASPLYFSQLTGSLLALGSRLQCLYAAKRFLGKPGLSGKRGGIVLVGGGDGSPDPALATAHTLLKFMGATEHRQALSHGTDRLPAGEDRDALAQVGEMARWLAAAR